jgi:hypothetical protein
MMVWLLGASQPVMFFLFAFLWGTGYGRAVAGYLKASCATSAVTTSRSRLSARRQAW